MEENRKPVNPFAFPNTDGQSFCNDGMTLRDYFAGLAMQAILSNEQTMQELTKAYEKTKKNEFEYYVSSLSFIYSDAMLKQRADRKCEPIQLTEEWLLRFGFKKTAEGFLGIKIKKKCFLEVNIKTKRTIIIKHGEFLDILFKNELHQLQNLYYALTNEELTLKNEGL